MARFEIEGMKELEKMIKELGNLPQRVVTPAARKGMTIALKAARNNAPEDSGDLKKAIILKGEKSRLRGKKIYQVTLDPAMNDVFVKESADGKRSYYPASQEYGYLTKDGGYVPGFRFMKRALEENVGAIEKTIVETMSKEIDKVMRRGGAR